MARSAITRLTSTLSSCAATLALAFVLTATPLQAAPPVKSGKPVAHAVLPLAPGGEHITTHQLPPPPRPPGALLPKSRASTTPQITRLLISPQAAKAVVARPAFAAAPGAGSGRNTLVLYDNIAEYAWLGEAYAVQAGQLASHGGSYALKPAASYQAGDLAGYTGLIYIGSYYDTPLPVALLDDVLATDKPVLWMNDNIWQLAQRAGNFADRYGWTPLYFTFGNATTVQYKGVNLQRNPLTIPSGLLQTMIVDPTKATAIATAIDDTGFAIPWATRSGNLTYIGEVPFSYVSASDRYLVAADLISQVANPAGPNRKRALVRIEDVGPDADPAELRAIANYLKSKNVPFSVAVYPVYKDPLGVYNNGKAKTRSLFQARGVVNALRYMQARGGTLIMHGYTHQYAKVANPYSGVSADDFEFYRSHISADNYVIYDAPPAEDSALWAGARITLGQLEFLLAGLLPPTIFEPPHYAASAIDYQVFQQRFGVRYDRGLYAANWCPAGNCGTGTPDYTRIYGQFFPYVVRDIFGTTVIPENLGNVEPIEFNHNPPRSAQDIVNSAQLNTVVTDGVQSFFFHPYLPLQDLKTIVEGVQAMGYQFVSADSMKGG